MADETRHESPGGGQAGPQFPTDYSSLSTVYTNFCRVSVTPEELVLDFGLNTQITPTPSEPIKLSHRVVMRSEERRVGKECRYGWSRDRSKERGRSDSEW